MNSESPSSSRRWQFTWETLAHIPILRLYLFNPEIGDTSAKCPFLEASLKLDRFLLQVSWRLDCDISGRDRRSFLWIPVPRVLVDPGCSVVVKATGDYIEAKLSLIFPVNHPVEAELLGVDKRIPLSMGSDIDKFPSEGVNFFCKFCSEKLTRQPIRNFVEIPSFNWQEVADNWFGGCCSFGGASEKLVSKYIETFECKEGTCLLDRATIAICEHDLEGAIVSELTARSFGSKSSEHNDTTSVHHDFVSSRHLYSNQYSSVGTEDINIDCLNHSLNQTSYHENILSESVGERGSDFGSHCCSSEKMHISAHTDSRTNSEASNTAHTAQQSLEVYGSGFIIFPSNLSKKLECVELFCRHCSSPLGSYTRANGSVNSAAGGIRLFKCYISSSAVVGASDDAFRMYTLESMFTNVLIEGAQDELSFRTVVCDLRTKLPALEIVLLNSRAWLCSGFCVEDAETRGRHPAVHMQPVAKVLFVGEEALSEIEQRRSGWAGVEEVYMMNREIEELRRSLNLSASKLPQSCSWLQGMSLSFLER